jgi:hypothetical protein
MELRINPEMSGVASVIGNLAGVQKGLRRDTASMQTRTTQFVCLNEGNGKTQLGASQGAGIAATSTAENY